jgi:hypothetical protein
MINRFIKLTHSGSPTRLNFDSAWVWVANTIRAMFWRNGRSKGLAWCALNEHLLRDIGETCASAEIELLRSSWSAPLETLDGGVQVGRQSVFRGKVSA